MTCNPFLSYSRFASHVATFRVSSCLAFCHRSSYCCLAFPPREAAGCFLRLLLTCCFLAGFWLLLSLSLPSEAAARLVPFFVGAFFLAWFVLLPMLLLLMLLLLLVVLVLPPLLMSLSLSSDPLCGSIGGRCTCSSSGEELCHWQLALCLQWRSYTNLAFLALAMGGKMLCLWTRQN